MAAREERVVRRESRGQEGSRGWEAAQKCEAAVEESLHVEKPILVRGWVVGEVITWSVFVEVSKQRAGYHDLLAG
jgi:hypothetical protein